MDLLISDSAPWRLKSTADPPDSSDGKSGNLPVVALCSMYQARAASAISSLMASPRARSTCCRPSTSARSNCRWCSACTARRTSRTSSLRRRASDSTATGGSMPANNNNNITTAFLKQQQQQQQQHQRQQQQKYQEQQQQEQQQPCIWAASWS